MPLEIAFTKQSLVDSSAQFSNIAEFDVNAAFEFEDTLYSALDLIAHTPELHPVSVESRGVRYRFFRVKQRAVYYVIEEAQILVIRILGPGQNWQTQL